MKQGDHKMARRYADVNLSRKIGVEIECAIPIIGTGGQSELQSVLAGIFTQNGLPACHRGYSHAPLPDGRDVCVEYDASIVGERSSPYAGLRWAQIEVKTRPLLGLGDFDNIVNKMLDILRFAGARTNSTTAVHLHLEVDKEVRKDVRFIPRMLNLFYRWQDVLYGVVPASRRMCGYARPIPDLRDSWNRSRSLTALKRKLADWDRRTLLNINHLWSQPRRIEVRLHGGSLDFNKIRHFLILMNRLLDHAATRNIQTPKTIEANSRQSLEKMFISTGLKGNSGVYDVSKELRHTARFFLKRWKHFNPSQEHALRSSKKLAEGRV
jgi:hypothetical protein